MIFYISFFFNFKCFRNNWEQNFVNKKLEIYMFHRPCDDRQNELKGHYPLVHSEVNIIDPDSLLWV